MSGKTTFKVYFNDSENRGSFAIDAIATTVQGDWTSSTDDFAILTVDTEYAEYAKEILSTDQRVESYTN